MSSFLIKNRMWGKKEKEKVTKFPELEGLRRQKWTVDGSLCLCQKWSQESEPQVGGWRKQSLNSSDGSTSPACALFRDLSGNGTNEHTPLSMP